MTGPNQAASGEVELTLRERMPEYLAVFGVGLAIALVIGAIIGGLSSSSVGSAMGYTVLMLGVVFLLAGGATGGGYANMSMGAVGSLFGGRGRIDEEVDDPDVRRGAIARVNPQDRLRRGLRPEANPRAFWQVIGGFGYIGVGLVIVEYLG